MKTVILGTLMILSSASFLDQKSTIPKNLPNSFDQESSVFSGLKMTALDASTKTTQNLVKSSCEKFYCWSEIIKASQDN